MNGNQGTIFGVAVILSVAMLGVWMNWNPPRDDMVIRTLNERIDDMRELSWKRDDAASKNILAVSESLKESVRVLTKELSQANMRIAALNNAVNVLHPKRTAVSNRPVRATPKPKLKPAQKPKKKDELSTTYQDGGIDVTIPPEAPGPKLDIIIPPVFKK